ncbi:MAG: hypothetical protein JRE18_00850 [Deltaproteobacteria bacterium]|jgi:hypothetical protein|nr:hypothetical protein [Deltaproteobacteria bacterium]
MQTATEAQLPDYSILCPFLYKQDGELFMLWRCLTTFGRGLVIALTGILIKSAGDLVMEGIVSLALTTIGVVIFSVGLYMALLAMDNQFGECKELPLDPKKRK